jgi:hypothetical protein
VWGYAELASVTTKANFVPFNATPETSVHTDLELTRKVAASPEKQVAAAKLHVMRLEPIQAKMGDRWERLSALVHKLFEKSLQQMQGPQDHFLRIDDMSYVVSFHHLSAEEASLACAAVAKEVCELLFGADVDDISVRSLIGNVSPKMFTTGSAAGLKISELLEEKGGEIIVRHPPVVAASAAPATGGASTGDGIAKAHKMASHAGWSMGFFPVWDLQRRQSFSLYCSLYSGTAAPNPAGIRCALSAIGEARIVDMEVALLFAAAEYAKRLHAAGKICVLGVGASYETLSGFHTRIRYTTALKALLTFSECPIMIRLGPIPDGTPLGRIAEIVAMMNLPNVRVSLEFRTLRALPEMDIRLGAAGIGGILPSDSDPAAAALIAQRVVRRATGQKCFSFLHGLSSLAMLGAARDNGIRAGTGEAIGAHRYYTGHESVPEFPLLADGPTWQI